MLVQEKFLLRLSLLCLSLGFLLSGVFAAEIPLGSKISVLKNNLWISPNGTFALGFHNRSDQPNQYSVGIRFYSKSIPVRQQIVTWVAGADVAVTSGSYFQLTQEGDLVLFDSSKGVILWTSKTRQLSVASALLHDSGNLVLLNESKDVVWQSFDTPSDTLLPGQKLSASRTLRAASQSSVSSYYSLYMDVSGQLQLRWESSVVFWRSGGPSHPNLSAVLTSNGSLQLMDQNSRTFWSVFGEDHNDTVKFRFLKLDLDGNLRIYSWTEVSQSWRSVWQAVENQCNVFATCGQRGICVFNASGFPVCKCPFQSASQSNSRCLIPFQSECKSGSIMVEHSNTFLYGMYPANDSVSHTSLDQCKRMCVADSSCTAVTFKNDGSAECRMKKTPYVSGYWSPSLTSVSFVRSCSDPIAADPNFKGNTPSDTLKEFHRICIPCLIGAASGTCIVFVVMQFGIGFWLYKNRKSYKKMASFASISSGSKCLVMFSFTEINGLTGNFNHQIGPKMYMGVLPDNQPVAVKKFEATIEARKFRAAVSKMGSIHHKHLIKLEGFCCEPGHRYLVYEYAKNGSVEKYIEDSVLSKRLAWRKRMDVLLSVSRAIFYLHTGCREFVSHGNLKCENVVLDEDLEAKVSEYGLRILHGEGSSHGASAEKDVEDFGKMVLMLVSGCREVEDVRHWAYVEWIGGHPINIVDNRLDDEVDIEQLERALRTAFWCLQTDERVRPSMGEIVKVLEGILPVDPPPPPYTLWRSQHEADNSSDSNLDP